MKKKKCYRVGFFYWEWVEKKVGINDKILVRNDWIYLVKLERKLYIKGGFFLLNLWNGVTRVINDL